MATDIGGTFTDLVYVDEATGECGLAKAPTTPGNLERGVRDTLAKAGLRMEDVVQFVHGSTVVINAITERKGVAVGLVTTRGMRDVLEIARGNRPDIYNLRYRKPEPLVPRHLRLEVRERLDARGAVIEPLDEDDVRRAAAYFRRWGVRAVAVCFLHAYANPSHEDAAGRILAEKLPDAYISLSHRITKEWREYERTNTAVLNAYVGPVAASYLETLESDLRRASVRGRLHVMQSNGGTTTFAAAKRTPIALVESGPVGGVIGAARLGQDLRYSNVITLDIGGTTAKCSLVEGGEVKVTTEYKLDWTPRWAGYPVKVPVADIVEIGAGGGSIAWVDELGVLRVGPRSAGAQPGPACYGRGGQDPTVTDANLLAGRLNPEYFLGGEMRLDVELSRRAFQPLAERFSVSVEEAARGVIRLANANMMNALKIVSVGRGYDPREFALVAMGGGGALHAASLARELQIGTVIVPVAPGHFSAFGMLSTDLRRDFIQTYVAPLDESALDGIARRLEEAEAAATRAYLEEGFQPGQLVLMRAADLRYRGQEHTVRVPLPGGRLGPAELETVATRFHEAHEQRYTFRLDSRVELVNLHVVAFARMAQPRRAPLPARPDPEPARQGRRPVDFDDQGLQEADVYRREALGRGARLAGPAVIEEPASSTLIYPGMGATVDPYGNLIISTGGRM